MPPRERMQPEDAKRMLGEVTAYLQELLKDGPVRVSVIKEQVKERQWHWDTVRRVKFDLRIASKKKKGVRNPPWRWALPGVYGAEGADEFVDAPVATPAPPAVELPRGRDVTLEDLPQLSYCTKEEKRDAVDCARKHGVYNGKNGLEQRKSEYHKQGVRPIQRCWQRAAKDLLMDIHEGKIKSRYDPKSCKRGADDEGIADRLKAIGRECAPVSQADELRWIVTNMTTGWAAIEERTVPSEYAVSLLVIARANQTDFMKLAVPRLFPSKLGDDQDRGFKDDGRIDETLERQIAELRNVG